MKRRTTKILDYVGLIINYLSKRGLGGNREGLDGYPYLKHIIQLWIGDWVKHMKKKERVLENYWLHSIGS